MRTRARRCGAGGLLLGPGGSSAGREEPLQRLHSRLACTSAHPSAHPSRAQVFKAASTPDGRGLEPSALRFLRGATTLAGSTGLASMAGAGVLVFNGVVAPNDGGWYPTLAAQLQAQLQGLQEDVYSGRLTDGARGIYEGATGQAESGGPL